MAKSAEQREIHIQHTMQRCAHFSGVQHDTCEAGIRYDDVRQDRRIPCLKWDANGATCDKAKWPTREEAEAAEAEFEACYARVSACLRAIREKHGKARGLVDEMPCPSGCGGTLRYSIASYNGHIHGACSTEGCAQWMQ